MGEGFTGSRVGALQKAHRVETVYYVAIERRRSMSITLRFKSLIYAITASSDASNAVKRLGLLERRLPSAASRFAIPFVFRGRGYFRSMRPRQNPGEIERLYQAVCELRPRRVLEIGTAKGGTLYLWTQAAADDAAIVSLDLPGGPFGGGYPAQRVPFYQAFARPGQNLALMRADSHAEASLAAVRAHFGAGPVDFAFIDGDHTYEGVRQDVAMYSPLVREGGIVAFHDILPQEWSPVTQVHRVWNELKRDNEVEEFIDRDAPRQIGIGLIRVPRDGLRLATGAHSDETRASRDASSVPAAASIE